MYRLRVHKRLFLRGSSRFVFTGVILKNLLLFRGNALLPPLPSLLHLLPPRLRLVIQHLRTRLLRLLLVDVFHQDSLILEDVTFGFHVQRVVQVPVDLLGITILSQQSPQHSHSLNPQLLPGHTSVSRTFPLAETTMTPLPSTKTRD